METGPSSRVYDTGPVRYTETPPPNDLASDVVCFWTLWIDPAGGIHRQHLLPDLSVDVIRWNGGPAFVMGPPTSALHVSLPPGTVLEGARLRVGAAQRMLDCTPAELWNRMAPLDTLLRAPFEAAWREQPSVHALVSRLLRSTAARGDRRADSTVRSAIHWLSANSHSSVDDLSRQVNWSDRKLRRRFVASVGMGPKLVQRIVRVQNALHLLRARTGNVSLSDLAAECGFADQAHMTREVAHFTDHTPSRLRHLAYSSAFAAARYG